MTDGGRLATLGFGGLLAICCVSFTALVGGGLAVGGAAGGTAVATGASSARAVGVTFLVTGVTLVPIFLVWRWRAR